MTRFGPLDVLDSIGQGRDYDQLLPHSTLLTIKQGVKICLLNLETIIEVKRDTARAQDNAVLPILLRALKEKSHD
jgi:hypothetical protein